MRTRRGRWSGGAIGAVVALAVLVGVWRARSLHGLPDVGDPFDVAEARQPIVMADEDNAFLGFAAARARLTANPGPVMAGTPEGARWSEAVPGVRAFIDQNRPALELWREAAERPDALYHQPAAAEMATLLQLVQDLRDFTRMAGLEASRLEEMGDLAGAWRWHRASLRASRHCGRHGFLIQRLVGAAIHDKATDRILLWADDPRVDAVLLRTALDDALAADALTPPLSEALKLDYLILVRDLDEMKYLVTELSPTAGLAGRVTRAAPGAMTQVQHARVAVNNDRERSLRVYRLLFANWLAQIDKPSRLRAKLAPGRELIYEADPTAPPSARALPPSELTRAISGTLMANQAFHGQVLDRPIWERDGPLVREERRRARLIVALAEQLYLREHGTPPPAPEALVGPYLDRIPEGYAPDR